MCPYMKITVQDKEALSKVKLILEENLADTPSIKVLCKRSGLNADKLKKGFRLLYGQAPYQFHLSLRMDEAKRLLITTELSIREIAWTIGYEQVSGFCKAFRKLSGMTALKWKEKMMLISPCNDCEESFSPN